MFKVCFIWHVMTGKINEKRNEMVLRCGGGGQKVQYIPLGVNEGKFQKKLTGTASVGDGTG